MQISQEDAMYTKFWVLSGFWVLWLMIFGILVLAMLSSDFSLITVIPMNDQLIGVLSNALFLTVAEQALSWADCTFPTNGDAATLNMLEQFDDYVHCWDAKHTPMAFVALVGLV